MGSRTLNGKLQTVSSQFNPTNSTSHQPQQFNRIVIAVQRNSGGTKKTKSEGNRQKIFYDFSGLYFYNIIELFLQLLPMKELLLLLLTEFFCTLCNMTVDSFTFVCCLACIFSVMQSANE